MKRIVSTVFAAGLASLALAQWEPDVRVTDDPANSFLCGQQCLVALGDTLHAAFVDDRSGNFNVYHTRSLDAGVTWDSAVCVSPGDSNRIFSATVAASGADVHVAWEGRNNATVQYRRSTDGGSTWQPETTLVEAPRTRGTPFLAADDGCVGLVWGDTRDGNYNGELYYKQSLDAGRSWTPDTRLTTDQDSTTDKEPCLCVSGDYRYITWTRYNWNTSHQQVWFVRSADAGATWQPRTRVTGDTILQNQPMLAAAWSDVHVTWFDGRDAAPGIYYRGSSDNGASWGAERWLTDTTYGADYPAIAAARGNVHLAYRAWPGGRLVICYRGSTDNGQTWLPETILTSVAGMGTANLAAAGSRAHILLYDNRDGNFELYHKRNLTAGGVEEYTTTDAIRLTPNATIIRSVLCLPASSVGREASGLLLDACGRRATNLKLGPNDVSHLAPGVYFVVKTRDMGRGSGDERLKVVVTR